MIVDLDMAKQHIRRIDDSDDERVMLILDQAHLIVFDYLKVTASDYGSQGSYDIDLIQAAAVLMVVQALYDYENPISEPVRDLLRRYRDPAMT